MYCTETCFFKAGNFIDTEPIKQKFNTLATTVSFIQPHLAPQLTPLMTSSSKNILITKFILKGIVIYWTVDSTELRGRLCQLPKFRMTRFLLF